MAETDMHIKILEKVMKESAAQNKALLAMNKSLIGDISSKLTLLDGRVALLEVKEKTEENKFDLAIYFRDKVLPQILTVITLALLVLAFAQR